jgi:Beta-agarase/YXIM esterase-like, galactose-binding domain-like
MGRRIVMSLLMLVVFSLAGSAEINLAHADMIDLYNFDFGGDNSPVQNGWLQVTNNTVYSAQLGYGWDASVTPSNHTGANPPELPDMLRDFNHSSSAQTFEINLAAGTYNITLYFYDTANNSDNWTVYLGNGSTALATVTGLSKDAEVTR